jgi:thiamine biosynthesis protein ThiS
MITANHSSFKINGSKYLYVLPFTVLELMNYLGFNQKVIVVDYNGFILEKSQWEKTLVQNQIHSKYYLLQGAGNYP